MAGNFCTRCGRRSKPIEFEVKCDHCGQLFACLLTREIPVKSYCRHCYDRHTTGQIDLPDLTLDELPF